MQEICTIEIPTDLLRGLNLVCGTDYQIKKVDIDGFDYSIYPEWVEARRVSSKAYKKLKEIEYKIRHK